MSASRRDRAFLLVEAMLTVAVLSVGLVFITRGIGGSLKTLSRLTETERVQRLLDSTLQERETEARRQMLTAYDGACPEPDDAYRWRLSSDSISAGAPAIPEGAEDSLRLVTLTILRDDDTVAGRLATIWPSDWIEQ